MDMGGIQVNSNNIPSDEDFRRAKAADAARQHGLSDVRDQILHSFRGSGVHEVFLFYSPKTNSFGAYVFFRWERQIKEAENSGLTSKIKNAVVDEMERVGRGNKDTIKIEFEFDSHENVEANFEGDYYLRLR